MSADKTRSLAYQLQSVEHAAAVLAVDEEFAPGLLAAAKTIAWLERNAEIIKAVDALKKVSKHPLELAQSIAELAAITPDVLELVREFIDLSNKHPSLIDVLRTFNLSRIELGPEKAVAHA